MECPGEKASVKGSRTPPGSWQEGLLSQAGQTNRFQYKPGKRTPVGATVVSRVHSKGVHFKKVIMKAQRMMWLLTQMVSRGVTLLSACQEPRDLENSCLPGGRFLPVYMHACWRALWPRGTCQPTSSSAFDKRLTWVILYSTGGCITASLLSPMCRSHKCDVTLWGLQ